MTDERRRIVAFTVPYHESTLALLVKPESAVQGLGDLLGKAVGVKVKTTGESYLESHPGPVVRRIHSSGDLASLFQGGVLEAVVFDRPIQERWISSKAVDGRVVDLGQKETYAIAYRKGNAALGKELDRALSSLRKSGEMDRIMDKWLQAAPGGTAR